MFKLPKRKYRGTDRTKAGAWVVPKEQIKEFLSPGEIDYDSLILDCFPYDERVEIKRKLDLHGATFKGKKFKSQRLKDIKPRNSSA